MRVLQLKLDTSKYQDRMIERRFHALSHIHNVTVKRCIVLMRVLDRNKLYQSCRDEYTELLKSEDKKTAPRKKVLSEQMSQIRRDLNFSEYSLQSYIKVCGKQYSRLLSSQQVQKEVTRVWSGVTSVLFDKGKKLHFKKFNRFSTISGKTNTNGVKFDKDTLSISWINLTVRCIPIEDKAYMEEALTHDISYCEIQRMAFPNGYHYYVNIYLEGDAPAEFESPKNDIGIDPGVSAIAANSENKCFLFELAPDTKQYGKSICVLERKMDKSKRISNPNKFNADGTVIKNNKDRWVFSGKYYQTLWKMRTLYRKKSAYTKQSHNIQIKEILKEGCSIIVEKMNFSALQKRAKKTERSETPTNINGKVIYKFKKKKRFGKSLNNRAPSNFLTLLKEKAVRYGGSYSEIKTQSYKATQYNHVTDTCKVIPLSQRFKMVGEHKVQRDLYSAFLIRCTDITLAHADREKCIHEFDQFIKTQKELLDTMRGNGISMKQCFGF